MSIFTGPQGKGAMRRHRDLKRTEAQLRNATAAVERHRRCGHVHGAAVRCPRAES